MERRVATIGIAIYSFKMRLKKENGFLNFRDIENNIVKDFFINFFENINKYTAKDNNGKHFLKVEKIENHKSLITGIISCGEYGYSAEGIHVKTKVKSYERTPDDAEIIPFYFMAYIPDNSNTGIIFFKDMGAEEYTLH